MARDQHELTVRHDGVVLAGTLWSPAQPRGVVVMHPGSGPSDRENGGMFTPVREHLVNAGYGVAAFDKRGVGASTGHWTDAGIQRQAADAIACLTEVRAVHPGLPAGLYGHSQGGWVVLHAASVTTADFAVTTSGPGVSPAVQERFSTERTLRRLGWPGDRVAAGMAAYDALYDALRATDDVAEGWSILTSAGAAAVLDSMGEEAFVPRDAGLWRLTADILDYDPSLAVRSLRTPLLSVFGQDDDMLPVTDSVRVLRDSAPPELIDVRVYPGTGHTIRRDGRPDRTFLADLVDFLHSHSDRAARDRAEP